MSAEIESRLNQLTGNIMGLQTLVLAIISTSDRRQAIAEHLQRDAAMTLAHMNAESRQPDEVLQQMEQWLNTTVEMLLSDEQL